MPGKGNGGGSDAATAAPGGAAGNGSQGFPGGGGRGLDSGLAKSAPSIRRATEVTGEDSNFLPNNVHVATGTLQ